MKEIQFLSLRMPTPIQRDNGQITYYEAIRAEILVFVSRVSRVRLLKYPYSVLHTLGFLGLSPDTLATP